MVSIEVIDQISLRDRKFARLEDEPDVSGRLATADRATYQSAVVPHLLGASAAMDVTTRVGHEVLVKSEEK